MRSYAPAEKGHLGQIRKAVDMMMEAKRPVVYTGGGVIMSEASDELRELIQRTNFPVTNTLMGLGAYPATDEKFLGMLGMHGTYEANMAMHETDVLIAIGARFDDRVTGKLASFCPDARIVHIDVDPASISKTVQVDVPIVGQVKSVLTDMLNMMSELNVKMDEPALEAWWKQINEWRSKKSLSYRQSDEVIKPQFAMETLYKVTKDDEFYLDL